MILQSLHALYDRLVGEEAYALAAPGFSPQKISFYVVLHPDGRFFAIEDARVKNEAGKFIPRRLEVPGEAKPPGAGINPGFLWDNQTYLLGRQPEDKPAGFGQKRFEAFRQRHLALEKIIDQPEFSAVCRFLEAWSPERIAAEKLLTEVGTGFGVFKIVGEARPVQEVPGIRDWWMNQQAVSADTIQGQCLLSGETTAIARLHPKIKGVLGAQAAGASLVSFNSNSYESYGKEQSYNSPVGEVAAFRYAGALNALLSGPQSPKHRLRIGDSTCVFWTERPTILEDAFAGVATGGDHALAEAQDGEKRRKIAIFLNALRQGCEAYGDLADDPEGTRFFLLGLAPNAARLSVRFFYQSSIRELLDHLRRHAEDTRIVRQFEHPVGNRRADSEFPAYWEYLRETVRQGDDPPPLLAGALMRAVLEGSKYPLSLLLSVVRRIQIERSVNYLRASLLTGFLNRNFQRRMKESIDIHRPEAAYHLGRLFAVYETAQKHSHDWKLERTIRETMYSAASATPLTVFGKLERMFHYHTREKRFPPGSTESYVNIAAEINQNFRNASIYPAHLSLEEQALFSVGYYHQLHFFRTLSNANRKEAEPTEQVSLS